MLWKLVKLTKLLMVIFTLLMMTPSLSLIQVFTEPKTIMALPDILFPQFGLRSLQWRYILSFPCKPLSYRLRPDWIVYLLALNDLFICKNIYLFISICKVFILEREFIVIIHCCFKRLGNETVGPFVNKSILKLKSSSPYTIIKIVNIVSTISTLLLHPIIIIKEVVDNLLFSLYMYLLPLKGDSSPIWISDSAVVWLAVFF